MRELPARDVQGERHEGVLPRRSAPAEHEPRQTLEIEPNRRGKHASDEEHGGEREAPGHTVAQSDTFALVPADPPPPRHIIIIILVLLTFFLWVHSGQILPDRVSVPTQRKVSRNSESTVANRNTWKPYLGSTIASSCAKDPTPVSSLLDWKGTLEGGVITWNLNATWNSVMTNVSISDHFPNASTTLSKYPRALVDKTPIGEYHASNMSASLRYGQPPENTAMRMDGYTSAFHMSRTLLSRVNSKSGGKVRGAMSDPPSGLTIDAESMTAAPVAVLEDRNSAYVPRDGEGAARF